MALEIHSPQLKHERLQDEQVIRGTSSSSEALLLIAQQISCLHDTLQAKLDNLDKEFAETTRESYRTVVVQEVSGIPLQQQNDLSHVPVWRCEAGDEDIVKQ